MRGTGIEDIKGRKGVVAAPRPASTVILIRPLSPTGFEVFLLRRHQKSAFMAGNYVYPGGRVDRNDTSEEVLSRCQRGPSETSPGAALTLLGHRIAAIRELFEEAGVLLAGTVDGKPLGQLSPEACERFSVYREQLNSGGLSLARLADNEGLLLAPHLLRYFAHWITPEANPLRFDTRFFIALHPAGQAASPDMKETTEGTWITPRQAFDRNIEGMLPLSPPTLKTLEDLARFATVEQLLESLSGAESKPPVVPVATTINAEDVLIYPWDRDYKAYKEGTAESTSHRNPSTPTDNTTRLVFRQGRWLPFTKRDA